MDALFVGLGLMLWLLAAGLALGCRALAGAKT